MEIYVHALSSNDRHYCRDIPEKYKKSKTLFDKVLKYNKEKKVLAIQDQDENGVLYTVVPGLIHTYKEKYTAHGFRVSEVLVIPKEIRPDINKLLIENEFKGNIEYWDNSE